MLKSGEKLVIEFGSGRRWGLYTVHAISGRVMTMYGFSDNFVVTWMDGNVMVILRNFG